MPLYGVVCLGSAINTGWGSVNDGQRGLLTRLFSSISHDDVIKWKHFSRYWPFVRGTRRSPVNSPHKGQWGGALLFSLVCTWINGWVNNREAGDLRRHRAHCDVIVMFSKLTATRFPSLLAYVVARSLWKWTPGNPVWLRADKPSLIRINDSV